MSLSSPKKENTTNSNIDNSDNNNSGNDNDNAKIAVDALENDKNVDEPMQVDCPPPPPEPTPSTSAAAAEADVARAATSVSSKTPQSLSIATLNDFFEKDNESLPKDRGISGAIGNILLPPLLGIVDDCMDDNGSIGGDGGPGALNVIYGSGGGGGAGPISVSFGGSGSNNSIPNFTNSTGQSASQSSFSPSLPYLVENPTIDLDVYINSFTGLAKIFRLTYIAEHCPSLRMEALKMAINYVTTTYNVTQYQNLHKQLANYLSNMQQLPDVTSVQSIQQDMPTFDPIWVEGKTKKSALKLEKLDNDLKNYKSNSIKESIRRGHDDLGDHYLNCGDLSNALKCYSRSRDYCTSSKHVVNMCLNVIKVSIYLQNWAHVLSYVSKAESTPDFGDAQQKDANQNIYTKLKCAAGLAELSTKNYKSAAKCFLNASFDHCDFPDMLSPNNVAMYGGLCALATFDRQEIQKNVISSSSFKLFLELEPQLRDIIFKFYESKYGLCLKLLDDIRDNLLLDIYIAPHINGLYQQIRSRALIQYFSPYLSADMNKMAMAFNRSVPALENEVMQLILDGEIQARIDSHNKILYAKDADQRSCTFDKAIKVGREYQRRTKMLILRTAIMKNQICVKIPHQDTAGNYQLSFTVAAGSSSDNNN